MITKDETKNMRLKQFMVKVLAVCIMTSSISSFPITSMASVETVSLTEGGVLGNEKNSESEENADKESAEDTGEKEETGGEAALEDETGVQEEETDGEEKVEESADPESADPESADPESADPESADPEGAEAENAEAGQESTETDMGDSESADPESIETGIGDSENTNSLSEEVQEKAQDTETPKEPDVVGIDESLMGSITPFNAYGVEMEPQHEKKHAYIVADYTVGDYGEPLPELTYTAFGFEDGIPSDLEVALKIDYSGTGLIGAGTYTIEFENPVMETDNYIIDYMPGTLEVIKSAKIIYAGSPMRMYGEENPSLYYYDWGGATTYTDEFLEFLDTIPELMVTTADRYSPVGVYPVTFAEEKQIPNYAITYVPGTLEVIKRPLYIKAYSDTKVYGEENPVLRYEVDGLVPGDTLESLGIEPKLITTAEKNSPAGAYEIAFEEMVGSNPNYDIQYIPGILTIQQGEQVPDPGESGTGDNEANPDNNGLAGGNTETGGESTGNDVDTETPDQNTFPNIETDPNTDTGSSNMDTGSSNTGTESNSTDTGTNSEDPSPSIPNSNTEDDGDGNSIGLIVTPIENISTSDSIVPAENEMAVVLPDDLPDITQNEKVISTGKHRSSDSDFGSEYVKTDIRINRTNVFGGLDTNFENIEEINPKLFTGVDNKVESDGAIIIEQMPEVSNIEYVGLKGIAISGIRLIQEHTNIIICIWLLILFVLILLSKRSVKHTNGKVANKGK